MSLIGRKIKDSFKDLLLVSNNNDGVDSDMRTITDGEGTQSALRVSETGVEINGDLNITGVTTGLSAVEVYGLSIEPDGNLSLTTTNSGAEDISEEDFNNFGEMILGASGFQFILEGKDLILAINE